MASAGSETDDVQPVKRTSSYEFLPPLMSELRVVLLGNSWSQRSSVGNFILGEKKFNTEREPDCCLTERGQVKETEIVLINTPDLLHPNISLQKLTEHVKDCMRLSDPGPHVFLLVLQPEDFTKEHKLRLESILEHFSDRSFDHSLVLISTLREESPGLMKKYMQHSALKDMIRKCRYRSLKMEDLDVSELLTRLGQTVKENNGEHVSCDVFEEPTASPADKQRTKEKKAQFGISDAVTAGNLGSVKGKMETLSHSEKHKMRSTQRGLRILLLGKTDDKKTKLGNFITGNTQQQTHYLRNPFTTRQCVDRGNWRGNPLTVVKPPDIFSLSVEMLRTEMMNCVTLCPPGPNVLLLLVKPSDFTEENRKTLKFILSLFGPDAFKHSMVISTHEGTETSFTVDQLLKDCGERHYNMTDDNHTLLMQNIKNIMDENKGTFLTFTEETMRPKSEDMRPCLNLVLCGRRGAGKTSAAEAILGQTDLHSVSSSSECVKHQGEVCGCWLSLVELPALSGKPQETVMEESFRCVSLCDPEGVHVFILVLPVGPLTDEDKGELKTIQNTFSSGVNDFTMILFTVDSDPAASAVVDFVRKTRDVQELLQSCGGRHVVLNIKDQQQIPQLLDMVETMRPDKDKPCSYTTETFVLTQIQKITKLQAEVKHLETKTMVTCDDEQQSLRIVLIGKTGCGKSSSGNTILGRKQFQAEPSQTSVTKHCQKSQSEVDGRPVVVVDTPGLFDNSLSHDEVNEEMVKCISLLAPGPHVFLLVIRIGRLTPEEKEALKLIKEGFGKNAEKFTIILLTGGDSLEDVEMPIDEYIKKKCDDSFKKLISDCGGRYHVFNNREKQNRTQVRELIKKIDTLVKTNGGSCYTNEMLQEAEAAIQKEMERILKEKEEEMRREREELQRKHEEEMEEMKIRMKEQRAEIEEERKLREKLLEEMKENIHKEHEERKREQDMREEEERKKKQQEELQQQEWKQKVEALEQKIKLESESKDRKLEENRDEMRKERENWERKQKEWWENRHKEDEQRKQEEHRRLRKLQEEYEQERENYEKKRKEEDRIRREQEEKEKREIEEQQRVRIEKEKKLREKLLEEKEENIKKECEQRKREQEMREEEERKRKQQEEIKRQQWEQKVEALEQKIRSESESKDRKLEENRDEMRKQQENWEKQQKEWWEKRHKEDEQRKQEEQIRLRKLQEEYEQERENNEKKRKEEDRIRREQMEKEKKDFEEEQRAKVEKEKKLREKLLGEKEENIKKEREQREKEQEMREEEERNRKQQEEIKRQKWEEKVEALEQKIKSESESKDRKLEENRDEMRKQQENWEKQQKEWWENRHKEDEQRKQEEQIRLRKLQEEYEQERENNEKKRKEEDRIRREQEEKEKREIEEKCEKEIENLKKTYEEKARKKAEEYNDFREKYRQESAALEEEHEKQLKDKDKQYDILKALIVHNEEHMKKEHQGEMYNLMKHLTKKTESLSKIKKVLKEHEEEMKGKSEEEKKDLQLKHEEAMMKRIPEVLNETDTSFLVRLGYLVPRLFNWHS